MSNESDLSVLQEAQDFIVLRKLDNGNYAFAVKPSIGFQKGVFAQSVADPLERDVSAFRGHWKFDEEIGIKGSSTFLGLRADNRVLRPKGLRIPSYHEARAMEEKGKLENGVYRDFGITVKSDGEPNRQIAQDLVSQATQLDLELPLVVPFSGLNYSLNTERDYGIAVSFVESPQGIISEQEAIKVLDSLDYHGSNSGVQRLSRIRLGDWGDGWSGLDDSGASGRVDWICGEATRENLMSAYETLVDRKYGQRISELQKEQRSAVETFEKSLS